MFVGGVTSAVTAGGATRSAVDVVHVIRRRQGEGLSLAYDGSLFLEWEREGEGSLQRRDLRLAKCAVRSLCR